MQYDVASKLFDLPVKALQKLKENGFVDEPLSQSDRAAMTVLSHVWHKDEYLQMMLARRTKKKRKHLFETIDMSKPEKYMFNRFLNHYEENDKTWLYIDQVVEEAARYYKIPMSKSLLEIGKRMNRKAKNSFYHKTEITGKNTVSDK